MRDIKDRPRYLSQWTNKELIDGCSRAPSLLAECGFDTARIYGILEKRGAKHANLMDVRRRTRNARKANIEQLQVRCGLRDAAAWKAEMPHLVQGIADLRGSDYQACLKSVRCVMGHIRAGIVTHGPTPGFNAIPILAFWAFVARYRGDHAGDVALATLLARIAERREKRLEGKRYNIG